MPAAYFLDTSALIPQYLTRAPGHAWVESICAPASQNIIAIAEITEAEFAAALNQLARGGTLRRKRCDTVLALFWVRVDTGAYTTVPVSSQLIRRAAQLCSVHSLKGYDAVQLAAALTFRDDIRVADAASLAAGGAIVGDPIFLTEDNRLAAAAGAEGFTVDSPLAHP